MNLHLTGTESAKTVPTAPLERMRNAVHLALTLREIALAYGPPGTGKTFAAHTVTTELLADLAGTNAPRRLVRVQVPRSRSQKVLYVEWLHAITGGLMRGTEYELKYELIDLLSDGRTVSLIDEAQHLGADGLEQVREIYDRIDGNLALVVVGSSSVDDILRSSPQLQSRVARPVVFYRIDSQDLCSTLARYHPMFDGAPAPVIHLIDARFAHCNFRKWARVLQAALRLAPHVKHTGPLNETLAKVIIHELTAGRR